MKRFTNTNGHSKANLAIAITTLLCCWGLFLLDYETESLKDLLSAVNLVTLMIYFIPTFLVSYFLYHQFITKNEKRTSVIYALALGVPVGFTLIIASLIFIK